MDTNLNPFDLTGPHFLFLFAAMIVASLIALRILRSLVDQSRSTDPEPTLDRYELAYLAGGPSRVTLLALATIVDQTRATLDRKTITIVGRPDPRSHAIERTLLASGETTMSAARQTLTPQLDSIRHALQTENLLLSDASLSLCKLATIVIGLGLAGFGSIKILVGLSRGRPVEFLVLLTLLVVGGTIALLFRRVSRTRRGNAMVRRIRTECPRDPRHAGRGTLAAAASDPSDSTAAYAGSMVALYGMAALSTHPDFAQLNRALGGTTGDGGSTFIDSGGGSSCSSSSSSCGGGGGCGGCGGG